jgi:hypothetical protein
VLLVTKELGDPETWKKLCDIVAHGEVDGGDIGGLG